MDNICTSPTGRSSSTESSEESLGMMVARLLVSQAENLSEDGLSGTNLGSRTSSSSAFRPNSSATFLVDATMAENWSIELEKALSQIGLLHRTVNLIS